MSSLYSSSASILYEDNKRPGNTIKKGACLRAQYYSWYGYPKSLQGNPRLSRIRDMGNYISDMFVKDFMVAGIYVAHEVSFHIPEINVSGRFDVMIKDPYSSPKLPMRPSPKDLIGVELKSTGGYMNIRGPVISTKDHPLAPKPEHVLQSMVYLNYYKKFGVSKWLLIYVDRADLNWVPHTLTLDVQGSVHISNEEQNLHWPEFTIGAIYSRYKELWTCIENKNLPDRDYSIQYSNTKIAQLYTDGLLNKTETGQVERIIRKKGKTTDNDDPIIQKGDFQCAYCDYKDKCWSNLPESVDTDSNGGISDTVQQVGDQMATEEPEQIFEDSIA